MKKPIEWHKECLKNRTTSLEGKIVELDRLQKQIAEDSIANDNLDMQINIAIQRGMDGFDTERFLKTKSI